MEYFFLILVIFGNLNKLCSGDLNENRAAYPVTVSHAKESESDAHEGIVKSGLSSKNLTEIQDLAKNISHSKGIYREVGDKVELRRSILKKARVASESDVMKEILSIFDSEEDKLKLLEQMEYMVHQYDVAISFANMGGIKIIAPLLFSSDDKMVSSTLLVLGAAMQSNPTVQKIAKDLHFGRVLLYLLTHKSHAVLPRVVFALSSYLRNAPDAQEEFFLENGISIIADIMINSYTATNTKLKIINLFNDLAVELKTAEEYQTDRSVEQIIKLQRLFTNAMLKYEVCDLIASFLSFEDYDIHLRTIEAMLSLNDICHIFFKSKDIIFSLERLLTIYYPGESGIDKELKTPLYNELQRLYKTVSEGNPNVTFQYYKKIEL